MWSLIGYSLIGIQLGATHGVTQPTDKDKKYRYGRGLNSMAKFMNSDPSYGLKLSLKTATPEWIAAF